MSYEESTLFVIASTNQHKIQEIQQIIPSIDFLGLKDFAISTQVEETGATFFENALLKAEQYHARLRTLIKSRFVLLSEDSGLCIDALHGKPGIFSSRYGKNSVSAEVQKSRPQWQLELILQEMQGISKRDAHFTCSTVLYFSQDNYLASQATWSGSIVNDKAAGSAGFGYDPIFFLEDRGCCSAELESHTKNKISHRAQALERLKPTLIKLATGSHTTVLS